MSELLEFIHRDFPFLYYVIRLLSVAVSIGGMFYAFWFMHTVENDEWYAVPTLVVILIISLWCFMWGVFFAED
jgi:hypothetical protein